MTLPRVVIAFAVNASEALRLASAKGAARKWLLGLGLDGVNGCAFLSIYVGARLTSNAGSLRRFVALLLLVALAGERRHQRGRGR